MALEIAASVRSGFGAISNWRISGHFNVGHHDINAVPFGVSVSGCVPLHCDTYCPGTAGGSARIAVPPSHIAKWRGETLISLLGPQLPGAVADEDREIHAIPLVD